MSFICAVIGLWSAGSDGGLGVQDRPAGLAVQDRPECRFGWRDRSTGDRPAGLAVQDRPGLAVQDRPGVQDRLAVQDRTAGLAAQVRLAAQVDRLAGQDARFGEQDRGRLGLQRNSGWQCRIGRLRRRSRGTRGEVRGAAVGRAVPLRARGGAAGATRQPLWARTGMPWSSLHWLVILIRAGSSEPGAPSPGAAAGVAFGSGVPAAVANQGLQCRL